jgi:alpha-glucosidase
VYEGPTTVDLHVTLAALPRYVRAGAILPHGPLMQHTGERPSDPLTLELYPADEVTRFVLYEDSGDGFDHRDADCYSRTTYTLQRTATGATLIIDPRQGACPPPPRTLELRVRRVDQAPTGVTLAGADVPGYATPDAIPAAGPGWAWDDNDLALVVRLADTDDVTVEMTYDPTVGDPRPWVLVPIEVQVPAGTPPDPPIHIASSVDGWIHHALTWTGPQTAAGVLAVPRGEWFYFKYTRGDWTTVEKWPACVEADNRYSFGAARASRADTVWTWADWCP